MPQFLYLSLSWVIVFSYVPLLFTTLQQTSVTWSFWQPSQSKTISARQRVSLGVALLPSHPLTSHFDHIILRNLPCWKSLQKQHIKKTACRLIEHVMLWQYMNMKNRSGFVSVGQCRCCCFLSDMVQDRQKKENTKWKVFTSSQTKLCFPRSCHGSFSDRGKQSNTYKLPAPVERQQRKWHDLT